MTPRRLITTVLGGLMTTGAFASPAIAEPSLDTRVLRPSSDARAGLVLEPMATPGPWQWDVGAWLRYSQAPVLLGDPTTGGVMSRPVGHRLSADIVAGLGLGDRVAVGVDVPAVLWQDGTGSLPASVVDAGQVDRGGLGDIGLLGKVTVVGNERDGLRGGLGLALLGDVTLPTGNRNGFEGEGAVTASARVAAEMALGVGAVQAQLGVRIRTVEREWPRDGVDAVRFGQSIPWTFGFVVRPRALFPGLDGSDAQSWELALHGALPAGPVAPFGLGAPGASLLSPVLLAIDDRIALLHSQDVYLLAGVDLGLDHAVGVPMIEGVVALGWAPRAHDGDGDGVPDDVDQCPELPEDHDGIQDDDGCPEDDADGDGVLDTDDACPLVPGVVSNERTRNGCPASGAK